MLMWSLGIKRCLYFISKLYWLGSVQLINGFDWIKKGIRNADIVARKLRLTLTRPSNQRLEVAKKKRRKMNKIVERRKTKAMAKKQWRVRGRISLANEVNKNYESDLGDETNPDQVGNDKKLLQLWEWGAWGRYKQLKWYISYGL